MSKLVICSSASSGAKEPPKQGLGKPEQDIKRRKVNNPPGNIVELDAVSSDDDDINIVLQRWLYCIRIVNVLQMDKQEYFRNISHCFYESCGQICHKLYL